MDSESKHQLIAILLAFACDSVVVAGIFFAVWYLRG